MNAPNTPPRTAAETALAESFDAALAKIPAGEARSLREAAFSAFYDAGLPHRRVEAWHYTDLRALMRQALPLAPAPAAETRAAVRAELAKSAPAQRLVVVDGVFAPELSDTLPEGVKVRSLTDALASGEERLLALLGANGFPTDPAVALNAALMQDGVVIEVAPGAEIVAPLRLVTAFSAGEKAVYLRSALILGAGAKASLVEESLAGFEPKAQVNAALVVEAADDASCGLVSVFAGYGRASLAVCTLIARLGARTKFDGFSLVGDAGVLRRQIFMRFDGADAAANVNGVNLLRGREHADVTLFAQHAAPGCAGREIFKYVLDEEAVGVFQGKITVDQIAQKTDGRMLSKALLLSDSVAMNNKPELEIFADDVACGHGATCGGLSEDQLFYLQARGLPRPVAESLLLEAFAADLTDELADEAVAAWLREKIVAWLGARGEGGQRETP
ncbi:SufB/SufD family protein [Methylocella sp.]|uniref:SufB/SufD family protein n=1 Tax=Methylocella sp. TaxID=1978226 RepID=UPI0037835F95